MTGTYLYIFFRVRTGPLRPWMGWLQSTLDMMAVGAVIVTDLLNTGAPYAFTSGATTIIVFGVVLSSLRLMPYLAIYSSVLGVAVYLVAYAYTYATMPAGDGFSRAVLLPNIALRCLVVLMTGIVGALLSRSLRTAIARAISSMRDRERVHMAFGRYVDTRVVDRILKGDLKLTAERRSITVMFVDIRGFTRLSEAGDPEVLFRKLSETLDAFAIEVQREGGFVNKFLGDGLMAIFGAPESHPDHARRAVRAALQIEEAARQRREDVRALLDRREWHARVGLRHRHRRRRHALDARALRTHQARAPDRPERGSDLLAHVYRRARPGCRRARYAGTGS